MAGTTGRGAGGSSSRGASTTAGRASGPGGSFAPPDDDTQTRFLREMALRLPLERVVEAHVFPSIRQGGAETGVAVIAARREETVGGGRLAVGDDATGGARNAVRAIGESDATVGDRTTAGGAPPHGEVANPDVETKDRSSAPVSDSSHQAPPADTEASVAREGQAGEANEARAAKSHAAAQPATETQTDASPAPTAHRLAPTGSSDPHTVFSARYRLTLKGPDRGKWELDVVEEADAPLVTVDAVVRGVQRRAGEGAEAQRFTAEQLRAIVAGAQAAADAPPARTGGPRRR